MKQREFPFTHCFGRKTKRGMDVLRFQVRIGAEDLVSCHAFGDHANDGRDWDAQPPDARDTIHLLWINGDSGHGFSTEGRQEVTQLRPLKYTPITAGPSC